MEGTLVAHETLHSISIGKTPNFVIKLDMMKAYDRVCWNFLFKVLHKFGFSKAWCKWVRAYVSGTWFLVVINGVLVGFFSSTQAVRQGDPLSLGIFIIMAKSFSRHIQDNQTIGLWKGACIGETSIFITHTLFVDDTLLFGTSSVSQTK